MKNDVPKPTGPHLLHVVAACSLTPNMIRLTLAAPALTTIPSTCAGGHCKLFLPDPGEGVEAFTHRLAHGPRPVTRTYTVRHARPDLGEIDIDLVNHGDTGPASAFARGARPGAFLGFSGPAMPKLTNPAADWYLIAADMSALPAAAATLEALPRDARGVAIFEITSADDRQEITAPPGIVQHWLHHPNPACVSRAQPAIIRALPWPQGRVQTMIAGEQEVIRDLRLHVRRERGVARQDAYVSGYWRIGLSEDGHQKVKRVEAEEDERRIRRYQPLTSNSQPQYP